MSTLVIFSLTTVIIDCEKMYSIVNKLSFSEWLNNELIKRDMSQADLARKSNLTTGAISNFINDLRKPSPDALSSIAKGFNMSAQEIFIAAGYLPEKPEKDQLSEEAEYLLSQLSEFQRRQAVNFIRYLAEQKGGYATETMEKDEHP